MSRVQCSHHRPGHTITSAIILNRVLCNPKMNRQGPGVDPVNFCLRIHYCSRTQVWPMSDVVQSNLSHSVPPI